MMEHSALSITLDPKVLKSRKAFVDVVGRFDGPPILKEDKTLAKNVEALSYYLQKIP